MVEEPPKPLYYTKTPVNEVLGGKENLRYIGVIFTAHYCPPCQKFMEPLKAFYDEFAKDGKFELVLVNCDKREKEFHIHLKEMEWCYALPFNATDQVIFNLEDICYANVIPKLSVFSVAKGFEKPVVNDIK